MTGWRRLITATVRLAHRDRTRLQRRPADGRLLFEPVGETTSRSAERVRGIVTGTWALSAEICQAYGDPGDPVTLGRGGRGTRCGDCREPGYRLLPRPAWHRKRETGHEAAPSLLEDLVGTHGPLMNTGGQRLDTEVGYGLPIGSRFVGTPRAGVRTSEYGRDYRIGYGIQVLEQGKLNLQLGVDAERRESPLFQMQEQEAATDQRVLGRATVQW